MPDSLATATLPKPSPKSDAPPESSAPESDHWRRFFLNWPRGLSRGGVLVTSYDEQIPFKEFMTADELLLVERVSPDTTGARKVVVPYAQIVALKVVDVVENRVFRKSGFTSGRRGAERNSEDGR